MNPEQEKIFNGKQFTAPHFTRNELREFVERILSASTPPAAEGETTTTEKWATSPRKHIADPSSPRLRTADGEAERESDYIGSIIINAFYLDWDGGPTMADSLHRAVQKGEAEVRRLLAGASRRVLTDEQVASIVNDLQDRLHGNATSFMVGCAVRDACVSSDEQRRKDFEAGWMARVKWPEVTIEGGVELDMAFNDYKEREGK